MGFDREYLRGVALSTALLTLPSLSVGMAWLFFFAPLPLIYFPTACGTDKGFKIITHAILLASGITWLTGTVPVLLFSLTMMPAGFVVARSLRRQQSVLHAFGKGTFALGVTWILAGVLLGVVNHANLYRELLTQIDAGLVAAYAVYSKAPEIPLEAQAELQAAFPRIRETVPKILPGVLATIAVSTVWFNIMLGNWLLTKKGASAWGDLSEWRLPYPLVWVFIAAGLMMLVPGGANIIGLNLMLVMVTLYFLQGYEVFNSLCRRWTVPNPIRVMVLIFLLVIQPHFGFILLGLLGLADIWADFRKPKTIET